MKRTTYERFDENGEIVEREVVEEWPEELTEEAVQAIPLTSIFPFSPTPMATIAIPKTCPSKLECAGLNTCEGRCS